MRRYKPKCITFLDSSFKDAKTKRWAVCTEKDGMIGLIQWFGAWRKYVFFPNNNTLYEQNCLRDIANFIEAETKNLGRKNENKK